MTSRLEVFTSATPYRTHAVLTAASARQIFAAFESAGPAEDYVRDHNNTHGWTNRESKARIIAPGMQPIGGTTGTIARYLVVVGPIERRDATLFEWEPDAHEHAKATIDPSAPKAVYAIPFFPNGVTMPLPPRPDGHWASMYLTADLALFSQASPIADPHVLLVTRSATSDACPGMLAMPGGFVDPEESSREAAARETAEETGVKIDPADLTQVTTADQPGRDPRGRIATVVYTATFTDQPTATAGDDADRAAWYPLSEVLAGELAFDHHDLITTAARAANLI